MFLHLINSADVTNVTDLSAAADSYWKGRLSHAEGSDIVPFLRTTEGAPFEEVFRALRLPHIINDIASAKLLECDGIIPISKTTLQRMDCV